MQRPDRVHAGSALALAAVAVLGAWPLSLAGMELRGATLFRRAPWQVELVSYTTNVGQVRAEYFFTVDMPEDADASLGELQIRQTRGADRNFRFSPERTEAFFGRPRQRGAALPVEASFSQQERLITVRFPEPVAPGATVTVRVRPWNNPMTADTYMFQVTALPAGPNPSPAPLGFGTLRIYRTDWR